MLDQLQNVTNPTKEDLNFQYNSMSFVLKAHETRQYPAVVAQHAAKKLADRENNKDKPVNAERYATLMSSYLGEVEQLAQKETPAASVTEALEEPEEVEEVEKKKPGRPKKSEE